MSKKKRKELALWRTYTRDEMIAVGFLHAAFGTVTHITADEFHRPWQRIPGARTDRCENCMTYWNPRTFPKCGWCGDSAND